MNAAKQAIIADLIDIMSVNQATAIRTMAIEAQRSPEAKLVHQTPMPAESMPPNRQLARFNLAAELASRLMNDVKMAKQITKQYTPGIIDNLIDRNPTDYGNPQNVQRIIDQWLGNLTINENKKTG